MTEREQGAELAAEIVQFIEDKYDLLTPKERFTLALGARKLLMEPGEIRTRTDISNDAGVSREAIRQIEERGLRKCRRTSLSILAKEHLIWK